MCSSSSTGAFCVPFSSDKTRAKIVGVTSQYFPRGIYRGKTTVIGKYDVKMTNRTRPFSPDKQMTLPRSHSDRHRPNHILPFPSKQILVLLWFLITTQSKHCAIYQVSITV